MDEQHRNFAEILAEIGNGGCLAALTRDLAMISAAVIETGKRGELTLKLTVKPNGEAVFVDAEVKPRVPEEGIRTSIFFVAGDGSLTRRDPNQPEINVRPALVSNVG